MKDFRLTTSLRGATSKDYALLIAISLIWVIVWISETVNAEATAELFYLWYPDSPRFHIWQPISYVFSLGNTFGLCINILVLFFFGHPVIVRLGYKKCLTLILFSAILSAFLLWAFLTGEDESFRHSTPAVGGSIIVSLMVFTCIFLYPGLRIKIKSLHISTKLSRIGLCYIVLTTIMFLPSIELSGFRIAPIIGPLICSYTFIRYWKYSGRFYLHSKWI